MTETAARLAETAGTREAPGVALPFREAPHNIEAEQALLGALLTNNDAADRVSGFLEAEHFFEPIHARIFEAATRLIRAGKLASPVTLKTYFEADEAIREIGGTSYLARLAAAATTIINAAEYGRIIYDLAVRRSLILVGTDMVNNAYDASVDSPPQRQIEEAEQQLYNLAERGRFGSDFMSFSSALTEAIDMAANAYHRDGHTSGIASGFRDIDEIMGGLQASDLVIVAGRPSMGKTAFGTNIAYNVARNYRSRVGEDGSVEVLDGAVVGFFSLEMSSAQLATRIISEQTAIASEKIRRGTISRDEFSRLVEVARELQDMPLFIDETGGLNLAQLTARARRLKRQQGLGLLIVDYLQLLTSSSRRSAENRVQEVTEITQGLKALAKELDIPVIALSQLSRQVESREDKRPQLSDLRESGSIEQDADIVMFLFREEYYLQRREPREGTDEHLTWMDEMNRVHQKAEIIIGKNRHGPTSTIKLHFEGEYTRFSDLAREDRMPERFD
jgi:replicative DNA helicase